MMTAIRATSRGPLAAATAASSSLGGVGSQQQRCFADYKRKAGVASPSEVASFVAEAGESLVVFDVRNPDFALEPGDEATSLKAPLAQTVASSRPRALNVVFDRLNKHMDLPSTVTKATPIITHCGGGGRGQKAKLFLEKNGFTKVINGGGPEDEACWIEFGDK